MDAGEGWRPQRAREIGTNPDPKKRVRSCLPTGRRRLPEIILAQAPQLSGEVIGEIALEDDPVSTARYRCGVPLPSATRTGELPPRPPARNAQRDAEPTISPG